LPNKTEVKCFLKAAAPYLIQFLGVCLASRYFVDCPRSEETAPSRLASRRFADYVIDNRAGLVKKGIEMVLTPDERASLAGSELRAHQLRTKE
jgi:hypothetical protein